MTSQTKNIDFVGVYLQSISAYLFFQIYSYLVKIHDSVGERTEVITLVEVFGKKKTLSIERPHVL